ncbi:MAG: hypothetical protein JWQ38_1821 [Flavipsychrobacter sp.]|nr:hypothetical protein [Flavipsychrobacter sp.]
MKSYVTAIIVGITIIAGVMIVSKGYNYKFKTRNSISVAGSAYYNFTADLIVWSATFERTSLDIKDAYSKLKSDEQQIRAYLTAHGVGDSEIVFTSIVSSKLSEDVYNADGKITGRTFKGYKLSQSVKIESKSIDKIEKVSREITELLQGGLELSSEEPLYYYTKLADLKINLLQQASTDAYNRATTIVKNAHGTLGKLKEANMGVFQITGQYSNETFTYSGAYNTSSKNKTANVIVRMDYELE